MFLGVTRCDQCIIILSPYVSRLSSDTTPSESLPPAISLLSHSPAPANVSRCHQMSSTCHHSVTRCQQTVIIHLTPVSHLHRCVCFHALLPLEMFLGVIRCHQPVIILSADVSTLSSSSRPQWLTTSVSVSRSAAPGNWPGGRRRHSLCHTTLKCGVKNTSFYNGLYHRWWGNEDVLSWLGVIIRLEGEGYVLLYHISPFLAIRK